MWQQWVNGIIGIVMIFISFFSLSASTYRGWMLWLGIIIAILGFWGAYQHRSEMR